MGVGRIFSRGDKGIFPGVAQNISARGSQK